MSRDIHSEVELLATVGASRVIPLSELEPRDGDVHRLVDQGLLQTRTVVINDRPERVVALTEAGPQLLASSRADRDEEDEGPAQRFYAGVVTPRELVHDAQLYRMFQTERARLEAEGATVTRVVLDYEIKADNHAWVHEQSQHGASAADARQAYASDHDLPFRGGHIHLPDLRLEYETADGIREHRDLELATEHYSRSMVGSKQASGFRVYRAAGAGGGRRGGRPADPHHLHLASNRSGSFP